MGHRHRYIYICDACGVQHAHFEVVPWPKDRCWSDGFYCVFYLHVNRCHGCDATPIPRGEWPQHERLWEDGEMRHARLRRFDARPHPPVTAGARLTVVD